MEMRLCARHSARVSSHAMTFLWRWMVCAALLCAAQSMVMASALKLKRASTCNGYAEYCNRSYSNVTHIGAHDSFAAGALHSIGVNQVVGVKQQLQDGVRLLQIQAHNSPDGTLSNNPSGIALCHTTCAMGAMSLEEYLKNVTDFMNSNPNEVVTLIIANNDNQSPSDFAKAFSAAGLDKLAYRPGSDQVSKSDWPTLNDMISKGQRLVVFMDYKASLSTTNYIIPEFKNVWENPYDQTSGNFNCTPDRYSSDPSNMMYLINHYLDSTLTLANSQILTPDVDSLNVTNSASSVLSDANTCAKQHNSYPTFVLVDFYNANNGSVFQAAAQMNSVSYKNASVAPLESSQSGTNGAHSVAVPGLAGLGLATLAWVSLAL